MIYYHKLTSLSVLHPYYKLDYIEMAWGGTAEQARELSAGNVHAKDWQDEARKVIEKTVSPVYILASDGD